MEINKHLLITLITILITLQIFSQNTTNYWLELKEGYDIESIVQTTNKDQTLCIDITNNLLENFLNNQDVYQLKKAFPTSTRKSLQRVYVITLNATGNLDTFYSRPEIENFAQIEDAFNEVGHTDILASSDTDNYKLPNDYIDVLIGGRNAALDLIKAPLAWKFSTGEDVLIGISDSKFDQNHPELVGQIIDSIQISKTKTRHGTSVSGIMVAKTNNGEGISSIAHNSKLVVASTNTGARQLMNGLLQLSQYPGVRVVNCSWVICERSSSKKYLDEIFKEVTENNVLVVAAAGNKHCGNLETYAYPASYNDAISVTSVGHRFFIGEYHDIKNDKGKVFWERSWKDCYNGRPAFGEGGAHRNDKINVCAPGQLVLAITDEYDKHPTGYRLNTGTSTSVAFVTGLAALIFSVNPALSPKEVKDIIETTADDIYYIPYNQPYIGKLGSGRINAYRAVLNTYCTLHPDGKLDLAMQNSYQDDFSEPDTTTTQVFQSPDIWVRNQDDGTLIQQHQDPVYDKKTPNYIYIRITNNSCTTSGGNDNLNIYWGKGNTTLSWPNSWNGNFIQKGFRSKEKIAMGDLVDTITIPSLAPGETRIVFIPWYPPNPSTYKKTNKQPSQFSLLARIESSSDPMKFTEGNNTTINVLNNNNISLKNVIVINISSN